jgi:hypothetical protein
MTQGGLNNICSFSQNPFLSHTIVFFIGLGVFNSIFFSFSKFFVEESTTNKIKKLLTYFGNKFFSHGFFVILIFFQHARSKKASKFFNTITNGISTSLRKFS